MKYAFKVGMVTKFKTTSDYSSRGLDFWKDVKIVSLDSAAMRADLELVDDPTKTFNVPWSDLQTKFGYQDVYTVAVKAVDQAKKMLSWLTEREGVAVWTSLDLSTAGRFSYTPNVRSDGVRVDVAGDTVKPHWSMGLVEVVTQRDRLKFVVEETTSTKPPKTEKDWKYDRQNEEWYRFVDWHE